MEQSLGIQLAQHTVYLMGISFMLGSLFTIFVLLILDMLRVMRDTSDAVNELDNTQTNPTGEYREQD